MASFGENLQREREMRGITLEEISAATKISNRFLEAIEQEDFAKLPGGIFTRSFVRAYAHYLGLDEERVLAEYTLAAPPQDDVDLHRIINSKPPMSRQGVRTPLVALLIATALLGVGYALYRYSRRGAEVAPPTSPSTGAPPMPTAEVQSTTTPPAAPGTEAPTPGASSGMPAAQGDAAGGTTAGTGPSASTVRPGTTAALTPATGTSGRVPAALTPVEGGLVLQVAATERAWVAVEADGKTALQRILNPKDVETLKAKESFDVTTGNAQGVILTLNGETLRPLGRHGEVKSVHLTRDDLKPDSP